MSKNNTPSGLIWTSEDVQGMAEKIKTGFSLSEEESNIILNEFFEEEEVEIMNFIYLKMFTFVSKKLSEDSVKKVK